MIMAEELAKTDELLSFFNRELIKGYNKLRNLKEESPKDEDIAGDSSNWILWQDYHCKKIYEELNSWSSSIKKYLKDNGDQGYFQYRFSAGTETEKIKDIILPPTNKRNPSSFYTTSRYSWDTDDEIKLVTMRWEKYLQNMETIILQFGNERIENDSKPRETNFRYDTNGAMLFYKNRNVLKLHKNNSGRSKIFNALWNGKMTIVDDLVIENGDPAILRKELCRISRYSSNENIDKAVAFFRKKLSGLPIEITAEKGFRLIISD